MPQPWLPTSFFSWKHPQADVSQHCPFSLAVATTLCKALVTTHSSLPVVEPSKLRNCLTKLPCLIWPREISVHHWMGAQTSACTVPRGIGMGVGHTRQCPSAQNCCILVQIIAELFAQWPSHSLCPNPGCFPPCRMLSGYRVWLCPWHPAGMAGQGTPEGRKVSKGLGPSSLWVPME